MPVGVLLIRFLDQSVDILLTGGVQAVPATDLREFLRQKSRKADQTSRPDPPVVTQVMPSRHQKSQQPSGRAPQHWS